MDSKQPEVRPEKVEDKSTKTELQAPAAPGAANAPTTTAADAPALAASPAPVPTTDVVTSAIPADDSVASDTAASETNLELRKQNALAALLKVLDSDDTAAAPPLRTVQKMCLRIPHLSSVMTRPQRLRLYTLLLLDGDDEQQTATSLPESWTAYAEKALETHVAVAQQAATLFPESLGVTVNELAGLFYHLGAETAFYFSPEMTDLILCVTYVVAGGRSADKALLLHTLYQLLHVLQRDFVVSTASRLYEPSTTALLRLMLQFYDPALTTHMDQQQVEIGAYILEWTRRLLVLHSDYETALKVLDWVLVLGDPVMIPYVAQAYLITHRQYLLTLQTKQELQHWLTAMKLELSGKNNEAVDPKLIDGRAIALMPVWSGKSLLQNANLLYRVTPLSTQRMLDFCLYAALGTMNKTPEDLQQYYTSTPCLPLERSDIASAFPKRRNSNGNDGTSENEVLPSREYIIVDCRSKASYDYLRLPTAILVGDVLSYKEEELEVAMSRLVSCRGHPLALFGTGRPIVEELNLLKIFAFFLINKKAFPFVCIVPGGFKTTIPLLRNCVIEAVMSPAAAASFGSNAKSAGADQGNQASNTAHRISAKLSEISGLLPHVETAKVRQKAEELESKAKESVAAAGMWGWGMMQRLREGLNETREHASAVLSSVATKLSVAQAQEAARGGPVTVPAPAGSNAAHISTAAAAQSATAGARPFSQSQQQQIFSLGEDGEEEDLDLITSIPIRPMRGTVMEAPQTAKSTANTAATTEAMATPERRPEAPVQVVDAITTDAGAAMDAFPSEVEKAPTDASPAPVSPTTLVKSPAATAPPATAQLTSGVARGASASQIAANIDAEFDELFGELNMSPLPSNRASALPTKSSAAVNEDDLFGV